MKQKITTAVVLLAMTFCLAAQPVPSLLPRSEEAACKQWVDEQMAHMSLDDKVGQLLVYKLTPEWNKNQVKLLRQLLRKYRIGGLLFSSGEMEGQVRLTNLAQQESTLPLMIAFDGEGGLGMRLKDTPLFPKNMALACIGDLAVVETYGREVARELREIGVNVNLAPNADVNTNSKNPVLCAQSFGEDPQTVAQHAVAYGRGLESGGVLSVSKHFPGHGGTDYDSHKVLPVVYHPRERLDSVELYPFREIIAARLSGIMAGHLLVPALEPDRITPTSLSRSVVTDLLREQMGFGGLVFSDALDMQALVHEKEVAVKALKAGNDLLLIGPDIEQQYQSILDAVRRGELGVSELEARCRKVLTYKYLLGLDRRPAPIETVGLADRILTMEVQQLVSRLHLSAVTVLGNYFHLLPLPVDQPIAILSVGEEGRDLDFLARFSQYVPAVACFRLTKQTTDQEREQVKQELQRFRRVVVCITATNNEIGSYASFLNELEWEQTPPMLYTVFVDYNVVLPLKGAMRRANTVVLAHSTRNDVQRHVADLCFAKATATGTLPIHLNDWFARGEGYPMVPVTHITSQPEEVGMKGYLLHRIDSVINKALAANAFPGCQVVVLKEGVAVYSRSVGTRSDRDLTPVRPTNLFDVGDLTQTTATLLAVMKLYEQGKLKLTDKASTYLEWMCTPNAKEITLNELLLHESGLPPQLRFYREAIDEGSVTGPFMQGFVDRWHHTRVDEHTYACSDFHFKKGLVSPVRTTTHPLEVADSLWMKESFKSTMLKAIAACERGEKRFQHSDLSFLILGQVVESITKRPLAEYVAHEFYRPMGLERTLFLPLQQYAPSEVMPTATNDFLRRQELCGYVYDPSAALLGGVAGHAGLFSTAQEVAALYQMLLDGGVWNGKRYLSEATVQLFTTQTSSRSHRGWGFDRPNESDPRRSYCASGTPAGVYGQSGQTGTCVWADPQARLVYVFLSNALCPDAWNDRLGALKTCSAIQQLIYQSMK